MTRLALLLPISILLAACGPDLSDLERYVAEVNARKTVAIEPIPEPKTFEAFAYVANDRRDPFSPPDATAAADSGQANAPDLKRVREPLEAFPLDALRMVGVISARGTVNVLLSAPDGVVYRARVGNYVGQNYGRITSISAAEMKLVELLPDGFGGWFERSASLSPTETSASEQKK